MALCVALPAAAGFKQKSLYKGQQSPVGIALDSAGRIHFSWQSKDYQLHHAWIENGKKRDEVVDALGDCGWWSSIAVDSAGRPHIAYHAERPFDRRPVLVYAHFDGATWQIEELGDGGYATAIAIDANDQPHIVHLGVGGSTFAFEYLHLDDGTWQRETTEWISAIYLTPMSLALDSAGKAHVVFEDANTGRPMYATNAEGDWTPTELSTSTAHGGSVVLDSQDHLHFALPLADAGTVRYRHFNGVFWVDDNVYDPSDVPAGIQNIPRSAALALGPGDRPQILFVTTFVGAGGGVDAGFYAYLDGEEWRGILLKKKNVGPYTRIVSGADGVAHGVFALPSNELQTSKYLRVALHDLTGEWTTLGFTEKEGTRTVTGILHVRNEGDDKSPSTRIALYLSDDATLDSGDAPFAYGKKVSSIKAGSAKDVKISFKTTAAIAGKHLIAVLDPLHERDEGDRTNDAIAGQLPN